MKVVITGAAGQISYSLIPFLCENRIFNSEEKLDLALVEIPGAMERLGGFVKELEDSAYSTVNSISTYDNIQDAVVDADWCLLVGSIPRGIVLNGKEIKERSDLLKINGGILQRLNPFVWLCMIKLSLLTATCFFFVMQMSYFLKNRIFGSIFVIFYQKWVEFQILLSESYQSGPIEIMLYKIS